MLGLSDKLVDTGSLAAVITATVAALYAIIRVARDFARLVRTVGDIPERLLALEHETKRQGTRLADHLATEERAAAETNATLSELRADVATILERRSEPRT